MSKAIALKPLNNQQQAFLNFLMGEARGDLHLAKDLAGYSTTTALGDVIRPLKDHIVAYTRDLLVQGGPKAVFGLFDGIDKPAEVGTANRIKAATEILDRIGVGTPEEDMANVPKAAIFILPPKNTTTVTVESNGTVTIENSDITDTIDITPNDNVTPSKSLDNPPATP